MNKRSHTAHRSWSDDHGDVMSHACNALTRSRSHSRAHEQTRTHSNGGIRPPHTRHKKHISINRITSYRFTPIQIRQQPVCALIARVRCLRKQLRHQHTQYIRESSWWQLDTNHETRTQLELLQRYTKNITRFNATPCLLLSHEKVSAAPSPPLTYLCAKPPSPLLYIGVQKPRRFTPFTYWCAKTAALHPLNVLVWKKREQESKTITGCRVGLRCFVKHEAAVRGAIWWRGPAAWGRFAQTADAT